MTQGETPTILFVDDEEHICGVYGKYFQSKGFQARFADDGCTAVNVVREGGVDLVVMDLAMPHVDGELGIEVIRDLDPDLPIIVVSGHIRQELLDDGIPGVAHILRKPVSMDTLEAAIRKTLSV